MVPGVGIEPTLPKEQDFKSCASTNFATRAKLKDFKIACTNFQIFVLRSAS